MRIRWFCGKKRFDLLGPAPSGEILFTPVEISEGHQEWTTVNVDNNRWFFIMFTGSVFRVLWSVVVDVDGTTFDVEFVIGCD